MKALLLILLCSITGFASQGIQTNVSGGGKATAKVDRMAVEKQKTVFLKCMGGPDSVKSNQTSIDGAGTGATGNVALNDSYFYRNYTALNLQWGAEYTDKTFTINFSHVVGNKVKTEHDSECGHDEYYSSVSTTTAELYSNLEMIVPTSVWFVRIEDMTPERNESGKLIIDLNSNDTLNTVVRTESEGTIVDSFFMTKPGNKILLSVKWNPESQRTLSIQRKVKVTLVGHDGCTKLVKERSSNVISKLSSLWETKTKADDSVEFLGCLLNDQVVDKVLNENSPAQMSNILDLLERLTANPNNSEKSITAASVLFLAEFARYKIAYEALMDISQFCKDTKVKNALLVNSELTVNGFMYNHYYLSRIIYRLKAFDFNRYNEFATSIQKLTDKKYETYSDIKRDTVLFSRINQAYSVLKRSISEKTSMYSIGSLPFTSTLYLFDQLNTGKIEKDSYVDIRRQMADLAKLEYEFKVQLGSLIWSLSSGSSKNIDTSDLQHLLKILYEKSVFLIQNLEQKQEWFSTPTPSEATSPYFQDMITYKLNVLNFVSGTNNKLVTKNRPDFLSAYDSKRALEGAGVCTSRK